MEWKTYQMPEEIAEGGDTKKGKKGKKAKF